MAKRYSKRPKVAIIAASQLDPNNWTARHSIMAAEQRHVARLVEAAQEANDWLSETAPGTDQHNRSKKLAKALKPFTR